MSFCVIIPTYNGGDIFKRSLESIAFQSRQPDKLLIIDSSSNDDTVKNASLYTTDIEIIPSSDFNHGGTRNQAANMASDFDYLIFMTQDAILNTPNDFDNIIDFLERDHDISAVCGRQLPHDDANPLAQHARYFNYQTQSQIKTEKDIARMGIKTVFMSNSFSAYRTADLINLGGFPADTILAEDMYVAAKMIMQRKKIGYCAEACVRHSHNYTFIQEFKRYFDTGVFHSKESWILERFGNISGEGKRFIISEFKFLCEKNPLWIPSAMLNTFAKYVGFKLGANWSRLPKSWLPKLSMHKNYWLKK